MGEREGRRKLVEREWKWGGNGGGEREEKGERKGRKREGKGKDMEWGRQGMPRGRPGTPRGSRLAALSATVR